MKIDRKMLFTYLLFAAVVLLFVVPSVHAFQTPTPTPTPASSQLAIRIGAVAAAVAAVLQGVKKFIPQINGPAAIVLSLLLAVAGAYATADPSQVLNIQFFITTISAWLGANGIYSFVKQSSGATPAGGATK